MKQHILTDKAYMINPDVVMIVLIIVIVLQD